MNFKVRYSMGLAFDEAMNNVVLIEKQKPAFLKGLWNAPGGKIEDGETPLDCMVREFDEETGVYIEPQKWIEIFEFVNASNEYTLNVFYTVSNDIYSAKTTTNEQVRIINLEHLDFYRLAPNINWMIPFCIHRSLSFQLPIIVNDVGGD